MKTKKIAMLLIGIISMIGVGHGLTVDQNIDNTINYIKKIILTLDGTNSTSSKILLDGTNGNITMSGALNIQEGALKDQTVVSADIKNGTIKKEDIDPSVTLGKFKDGINILDAVYTGGNVGIGTESPTEDLEVVGKVKISDKLLMGPIQIGSYTTYATGNAIAIGDYADAEEEYGISIGYNSSNLSLYSIAIGGKSKSEGGSAVSLGWNSYAKGLYSLALGLNSQSLSTYSISIGENALSADLHAVSLGSSAKSNGAYSIAVGYNSVAEGVSSTAIGYKAETRNDHSITIGYSALSAGDSGISIGDSTIATGDFSTAMGYKAEANGNSSIAIGRGVKANGYSSTAIGGYTQANGGYSTAMGRSTKANGNFSTAMGWNVEANGDFSTAMGYETIATGYSSTTMGIHTQASGKYSTAMGRLTKAIGEASTSFGYQTVSSSDYSTIVGKSGQTASDDVFAIAYGNSGDEDVEGSGLIFQVKNTGNTIINKGYLGIGTVNPFKKLHVVVNENGVGSRTAVFENIGTSSDYNSSIILKTNGGTWGGIRFHGGNRGVDDRFNYSVTYNFSEKKLYFIDGEGGSNETRMVLQNDGKLGLGTTSPTEVLDVVGNVIADQYLVRSDRRYKTNIKKLDNSLEKILSLTGYSYIFKSTGKKDIGLIAQEVEKVYPDLVHTAENGYKSVQYQNLVAPLIEAIKEQQRQIDKQQKEINLLKEEIKLLKIKK